MPGAISPATGLIKNANSTWLNGRPLDRDLAARLDRPVRLANDANCFALSEATDGAGGDGAAGGAAGKKRIRVRVRPRRTRAGKRTRHASLPPLIATSSLPRVTTAAVSPSEPTPAAIEVPRLTLQTSCPVSASNAATVPADDATYTRPATA